MSPNDLHLALLRPAIIHILRAQGFQAARPAAVDTLVDLAARYLLLVATKTAAMAWSNHGDPEPEVTDVRMALEAVGLLRPAHSALEDQFSDDDDMRGVEGFVGWMRSDANREIMRIAGMVGTESQAAGLEGEREDYLTGTEGLALPRLLQRLTRGQSLRKSTARRARRRDSRARCSGSRRRSGLRRSTVTTRGASAGGRLDYGRSGRRRRLRCPIT